MKIMALTGVPRSGTDLPGWFILPDSSILRSGNPFFIPDFDNDFRGYPTVIIKLDRLGKSIAPRFAHRYFDEATLGVMVRGEETLGRLRAKGEPWTEAVVFDRCCLTGDFLSMEEIKDAASFIFTFGECEFKFSCQPDKLFVGEIIASLSKNNTIKTGDMLLIPLADTGIELKIGENITASAEDRKLLEIRVR